MMESCIRRITFLAALLTAWLGGTADRAHAAEPDKSKVVFEAKGYLIARSQSQISPRIGGQVTELLIEEGQKVKKGDVLVRLDDTFARLELRVAEARLLKARARLALLKASTSKEDLAVARAEVAEAELIVRKMDSPRMKNPSGISPEEYRAAVLRADRAKANLERLLKGKPPEEIAIGEAEFQEAEALVAKARHLVDAMTIRAPFDGTVLTLKAGIGAHVDVHAFGAAGYFCEIANLREMEVEVDIQERDFARVWLNHRCQVRPEAFPDRLYEGKLTRIMPVANRSKGAVTVRVRLEIPEKDESLLPDMGAVVSFLRKE